MALPRSGPGLLSRHVSFSALYLCRRYFWLDLGQLGESRLRYFWTYLLGLTFGINRRCVKLERVQLRSLAVLERNLARKLVYRDLANLNRLYDPQPLRWARLIRLLSILALLGLVFGRLLFSLPLRISVVFEVFHDSEWLFGRTDNLYRLHAAVRRHPLRDLVLTVEATRVRQAALLERPRPALAVNASP